jgi:2-keto-4-pentenoate hydratase/2-oxohepta-3-ene-1,7-dioic acid hydratase in catechol pathway
MKEKMATNGKPPPAVSAGAAAAEPVVPARFIRFVDAATGGTYYGEPQQQALPYSSAMVLAGDPLADPPIPFTRTGRIATIDQLLSPIAPPNILCIGLNYMKHYEEGAKKRGIALPSKPVIFMKTSNTVRNRPTDKPRHRRAVPPPATATATCCCCCCCYRYCCCAHHCLFPFALPADTPACLR